MRKNYIIVLLFALFLISKNATAQTLSTQNITTDLPQLIPPSPTVSSLMKFEEVPVSNYTGVPDISIPLFSVPTASKNISVDINIKYHTSSVAADEISSDVGLGWNLISGGTISRTVKGHPDEELMIGSSNPTGSAGIYQTNASYTNNFYYFSNNILNDNKTYYRPNLSASDQLIGNEFIWTANRTDRYDTEQDLWQFSFFGRSGRFYIKKNNSGLLDVVPLDHYNIKIINQYDSSTFKPTGFTIFDDRGYKFIFDVIEISNNSGAVRNFYYDGNGVLSPVDHMYADKQFNSAFHLSKVVDPNNKTLIEYHYSQNEIKEGFTNVTGRSADFGYLGTTLSSIYENFNQCGDFPPVKTISRSSTLVRVKKLATIDIPGSAKLRFNYLQDREDSNLMLPETASSLKSVALYSWNDALIKKFNFTQEYRTVLETRMFLSKIEEMDRDDQVIGDYEFSYEDNDFAGKLIGKDAWGYFNAFEQCDSNTLSDYRRNVSPKFSTTDLLQKIKYPTGGNAIFDFESNQYSYIGDALIDDFSESKGYIALSVENLSFNKNTPNTVIIPLSSSNRKVLFYPSIISGQNSTRKFSLEVSNGSGYDTVINNMACAATNPNCCITVILEKDKGYKITWHNFEPDYTGTDTMGMHYFAEDAAVNNFLYGGGNRIRRIGYFDEDVAADYYKSLSYGNTLPAKEKKISYNQDNSTLSSGALVSPKPLFRYHQSFSSRVIFVPFAGVAISCPAGSGNLYSGSYEVVTTENNLPLFTTQGSAVGYKQVTVEEGAGKGKITYEYTSPLDFPNIEYPQGPPFVQPRNLDYKRGNLMKQTIYDNSLRKLSEIENSYDYIPYEQYTGVRFIKPTSIYNGANENYPKSFYEYQAALGFGSTCMKCTNNYFISESFWGGMPLDINTPNFIPVPIFETYGWVKLTSARTKNYFYDNGIQKFTEKNESFEYNAANKQITQHIAGTEDERELKTKYFYHSGDTPYSQNRISEIEKIESYKDGKLLETKKINYSSNWQGNVAFLPHEIQTSFAGGALQTEVTYDQYDSNGNILQYTSKSGVPVTIIWGYNQTYPIVKIVGAAYDVFSESPEIPAIVAASNLDAAAGISNNEASFLDLLDTFRKKDIFKQYQITTYTYDPLIGVRSVTPPSGIREVYIYDTANRLKEIREQSQTGNILKEFKYNYKP